MHKNVPCTSLNLQTVNNRRLQYYHCTAKYRIILAFPFYTLKDSVICNKVIQFHAGQFSWLKDEYYDSVGRSAKLQSIPNGEKSSDFRQVNNITRALSPGVHQRMGSSNSVLV